MGVDKSLPMEQHAIFRLGCGFPLERKKQFYYDLIYESTDILALKGLCLCGPLFKNKYKKGAALKWQRLFTRPPAEHGDQEDGDTMTASPV